MNTLMETTAHDLDAWAGIAAAQAAGGTAVDEKGVIATFYERHKHNEAKSLVVGSVVMEPHIYVKIVTPADLKNVPDRPVAADGSDFARFPAAYARYKARETGLGGGTPLRDMVWMRPEALARLKVLKIVAVEQLANVSDDMAKKIGMGARIMITKAKQQLEGDDVAIQDLRRENATATQALESMKTELSELKAYMKTLPALESKSDGTRKKPGTKRKRRTKLEMEAARAEAKTPEGHAAEMAAEDGTEAGYDMPPAFAGGDFVAVVDLA